MYGGRRYRMPVDDFAFPRMREGERKAVTRFEAERRWEPLFRAEIMAGNDPTSTVTAGAPELVSGLIDEYQRLHCEASRLHLSTLKPLLGRLKDLLGKRKVRELEDPRIIESLKSDMLKNGREPATINRYLAQLRHMTNWAIGRGYLSASPFYNKLRNPTGVRLLKGEKVRTRRLAEGEEEALLNAADALFRRNCVDHEHIARAMRARIEMALDFGLRRGEMQLIKNSDIDWTAKPFPVLTLRGEITKSKRQRRIPLVSPRVVKWLQLRRFVGGPDGHPYGDHRGLYLPRFHTAWLATLREAGITDRRRKLDGNLRWHDLRHECGSRLAERGMDVRRVQELLGHATITTTQRYFNTSTEAVGAAMQKAMGW
jgi:integrase